MSRPAVDLLVGPAAQVVTVAGSGPDLGVIPGGLVACSAGCIVAVGSAAEVQAQVEALPGCVRVEAAGKVVTPGLVDCHTHLVFGGWRDEEFELRLQGLGYMDILRRGGGILSTVRATRRASEEELFDLGLRRLEAFLSVGTTTVEAKSGYGLDPETELKCLRVARELAAAHPVDVVSTFLGAHAVPPEFEGRTGAYVDLIVEEMVPRVAAEGLAEFVDVFCEEGVFGVRECARVLEAGARHGLRPKVHADEFAPSGGAELAAEMGAVSADHLEKSTEAGLRAMAAAGVVAVVLPATAFFLRLPEPTSGRAILDLGAEVALATDFNPGSSTAVSLPLVMTIGCLEAGLTPAEALRAVTIGGARALGRAGKLGSLEPGKAADLVVWDCPSYRHLAYRFGENLVEKVIKGGRVVLEREPRPRTRPPAGGRREREGEEC